MKGPRGRAQCFGAWFTDAEAHTIRRAAARDGMDPSEWIRKRVTAATSRRPVTVSRDQIETAPRDLLAKLRAELGADMGIVPPMDRHELAARLATVLPHDLGGRAVPQHDRDACLDCLSRRVQALVRRGLGVPVAGELRAAGQLGAGLIGQLEGATVDQLNMVNAQWARAQKAREVLR